MIQISDYGSVNERGDFRPKDYCDNGVLPWDHWFGSFQDGTAEGGRLMQERYQRKVDTMNAQG